MEISRGEYLRTSQVVLSDLKYLRGNADVVSLLHTCRNRTLDHQEMPRAIPSISHNLYSKSPSLSYDLTRTLPEPRLDSYGPAYGTKAGIELEKVGKRGRTPPTPTSPGFGGGDMVGASWTSS